jgi:selenocysteine-specific elongation factor
VRAGDRFVLRIASPSQTIGGGVVIDPYPPLKSAATPNDIRERLLGIIRASGVAGVDVADLPVRLGKSPQECEALLQQADLVQMADRIYTHEQLETQQSRVMKPLIEHEVNSPLANGVSLSELRESLRLPPRLFDFVVARLVENGAAVLDEGLIRRSSWAPKLDEKRDGLSNQLLHEICASFREPPSVVELVRKRGKLVPEVLRYLEKTGKLVQVEKDRFYDAAVVVQLVGELREKMTPDRVYSPAELRGFLGISRKYLIPFLEYCDRTGVTVRGADGRTLRMAGSVRHLDSPTQ